MKPARPAPALRRLVFVAATLALILPAAAQTAPDATTSAAGASEPRGLWLTTDYPELTGHAGTATTIRLQLANHGLPPQRVAVAVEGVPEGWKWELSGGGQDVAAAIARPDSSVDLSLKVTPPAGAKNETYKFTVVGTGDTRVELPIAMTLAAAAPAQLSLKPKLPALRGTARSTFDFQVDMKNEGQEDAVVNLLSQAPPGFQVTFKEQYGQQELTSLPVKANESKTLSVSVQPPPDTAAGQYPVAVRAANDKISADTGLILDVTGRPSLDLQGPEGRLSGEATAGQERSFTFTVANTGTAPAREVKVTASPPQGWKATVEPETLPAVEAGQKADVSVRLTPSAEAIAGDYVVRVNASSEAASQNVSFRTTVRTSTWWGLIGLLVIAAAVVVLATAVTRYGRR